MGDYKYMLLQAKWDKITSRGLTARHFFFIFFALFGIWSLCTLLFSSGYSSRLLHHSSPGLDVPGFKARPGTPWEHAKDPQTWAGKAQRVKQAYIHAYEGYQAYAAGKDELLPMTNKSKNKCVCSSLFYDFESCDLIALARRSFNGWGVTLFDSLDTMLLMGLNDEFKQALTVVEDCNFQMHPVRHHLLPLCGVPSYLSMPAGIRSLLRDCYPLSRRSTVRIRSLR
jgi:hypothetical protein